MQALTMGRLDVVAGGGMFSAAELRTIHEALLLLERYDDRRAWAVRLLRRRVGHMALNIEQ
jgi:hypothetical protein